jgi:hypothetical protein
LPIDVYDPKVIDVSDRELAYPHPNEIEKVPTAKAAQADYGDVGVAQNPLLLVVYKSSITRKGLGVILVSFVLCHTVVLHGNLCLVGEIEIALSVGLPQ